MPKKNDCYRCKGLSREQLCTQFGDYRVFVAEVEHLLESPNVINTPFIDRVKYHLEVLYQALKEGEETAV